MQTFSAFLNVFCNRAIGISRLQQLHLALSRLKKAHLHGLRRDAFTFEGRLPENVFEDALCRLQVSDGNADVFDSFHNHSRVFQMYSMI